MTVTAAPQVTPHLEFALAVEFGGGRPYPVVASQREALQASRRLYGQSCDLSHVDSGWGNPYQAMAESVVAGLGLRRDVAGDSGDDAVDVVIVAYDGMDCGPWEHLGCRLTEVVAGRPRAFAVSGQGSAGPFTAMRTASTLVRTGEARRALVLLLEHGQVPVDGGLAVPQRDLAVGLVIGPHGPLRLTRVEVRPSRSARCAPDDATGGDATGGDATGLGLPGWARLARSLHRDTEFVLTRSEPGFGYRCELRAAR
jgi:hypothetical protein